MVAISDSVRGFTTTDVRTRNIAGMSEISAVRVWMDATDDA
jgi:hypothetical protein